MSGAGVIQLLSRSNNGIRISKFGWVLLDIQTPMWPASGMGHWKG